MHNILRHLQVELRRVSDLMPYANNPRTHSPKQIRQLAKSMKMFGFIIPILIDSDGNVITGHGRLAAAQQLNLEHVPTISIDHLTEAQKRAYIMADNRLAEHASWDRERLANEFRFLSDFDIEFDLTITGFDTAEIDLLIETVDPIPDDSTADVIPEIDLQVSPVSQGGDLWLLGQHRLLCGDATQAKSFEHLMGKKKAQMVFVDPPYNVAIPGHAGGLGSIQHQNFAMASGEMNEAEYTTFLCTSLSHLVSHSQDGSIHYICMDWRHLSELLSAARSTYSEIKNLVVWKKSNAGMGSFYRSQYELILVAKQGTQPHINNFELGQHGRYRSNVWDYPGVNSFRDGRLEELAMHPTVKPVALVADAMKDCSHRGGLILDCFAGSGTTLIAAEQTGRKTYAMELDPRYVDTAIRRWQEYAGNEATHAVTGSTFSTMRKERGHEAED